MALISTLHVGQKRGDGSTWGLLGLATSLLGAWLFGAWHIGQQRGRKAQADGVTLSRLLEKPLQYTEHAKCRMDCRCQSNRSPQLDMLNP